MNQFALQIIASTPGWVWGIPQRWWRLACSSFCARTIRHGPDRAGCFLRRLAGSRPVRPVLLRGRSSLLAAAAFTSSI